MRELAELASEHRNASRGNRIGEWSEYTRLLALNRGSAPNAVTMAKSAGAPKRVIDALVERASVGAAGTAGAWGTELSALRLLESGFQDWLQNSSAFYQLPIIKVPLQVIVGSVLSGGVAGIADPGEAAPLVKADIASVSVDRRKATGIVAMTQELLRQSTTAQSLISRFLSARVSEAVDRDAFAILLSGAVSFTGTASVLNDIAKLLSAVGLTTQSRPVFVVSPSLAVSMAVQHTNNVRAFPYLNAYGDGEIYGIPTLISAGAPASSIVLLDCARIVGNSELPVTDIAQHASLEMLDAPTSHAGSGSPTAATASAQVSLWQTDSVAVRATAYYGAARLDATAVASVSYAGSP